MLYRMKQNAVSLGNICVLSAMVLVTISTTMCLYSGCDDIVDSRYPRELNLQIFSSDMTPETNQKAEALLYDMVAEQGDVPRNVTKFSYLTVGCMQDGSNFITDTEERTLLGELTAVAEISMIPLSDYNALSGSSVTLEPGMALLYCNEGYGYDEISFFDQTYSVEKLSDLEVPGSNIFISEVVKTIVLVIPDADLTVINQQQREAYDNNASSISTYLGMDVAPAVGVTVCNTFRDRMAELTKEPD